MFVKYANLYVIGHVKITGFHFRNYKNFDLVVRLDEWCNARRPRLSSKKIKFENLQSHTYDFEVRYSLKSEQYIPCFYNCNILLMTMLLSFVCILQFFMLLYLFFRIGVIEWLENTSVLKEFIRNGLSEAENKTFKWVVAGVIGW